MISSKYKGEITTDHYGRSIPKHSHGTINIDYKTSSTKIIMKKTLELYERIINKDLLVRRLNLCFAKLENENSKKETKVYKQFDLFSNVVEQEKENQEEVSSTKEERKLQETLINLKEKYGKNAVLKGMNLEEGATTIQRNSQIGGHSA